MKCRSSRQLTGAGTADFWSRSIQWWSWWSHWEGEFRLTDVCYTWQIAVVKYRPLEDSSGGKRNKKIPIHSYSSLHHDCVSKSQTWQSSSFLLRISFIWIIQSKLTEHYNIKDWAWKILTFLLIFSPDCLCVRGARGPRAGGHRDGEAGRVPHLRGLLGAGARQRLQRACAHETVAEAQHKNILKYT